MSNILIEKNFKVTLNFKVQIEDITDENVNTHLLSFANYEEIINDPFTWKDVERQKRLLYALIKNEELVKQILMREIIFQIKEEIDFESYFGLNESENELELAMENLSDEEDKKYFNECINQGFFIENTEHIDNRFKGYIEKIEINEM